MTVLVGLPKLKKGAFLGPVFKNQEEPSYNGCEENVSQTKNIDITKSDKKKQSTDFASPPEEEELVLQQEMSRHHCRRPWDRREPRTGYHRNSFPARRPRPRYCQPGTNWEEVVCFW